MKLYEIPRNSKILLPIAHRNPTEDAENGWTETKDEMCEFKHTDGMYSLIRTPDGNAVHLSASAEVKLVDDHYELDIVKITNLNDIPNI